MDRCVWFMYSRLLGNLFYRPPRVAVLRRRVPLRTNLLPPRALNLRRGREAALHPHLGPQRRHLVEPRAHHNLRDLLQSHLRPARLVRRQPRDLLQLLLHARRVALPAFRRPNVHLLRGALLVRADRSLRLRGLLAFRHRRAVRRVRHQQFHLRRDHHLRRIAHVVGRAFRQAQARGLNPLPAILVRAPLANLQLDRVRRDHRFRLFVRVALRELKSRLRGVRLDRVM